VIDALNEEGEYDVLILDETRRKDYVSDIEGVMSDGPEVVVALLEAHLVTTSVGPSVLLQIAPTLYRGIGERRKAGKGPLNVIACENESQRIWNTSSKPSDSQIVQSIGSYLLSKGIQC